MGDAQCLSEPAPAPVVAPVVLDGRPVNEEQVRLDDLEALEALAPDAVRQAQHVVVQRLDAVVQLGDVGRAEVGERRAEEGRRVPQELGRVKLGREVKEEGAQVHEVAAASLGVSLFVCQKSMPRGEASRERTHYLTTWSNSSPLRMPSRTGSNAGSASERSWYRPERSTHGVSTRVTGADFRMERQRTRRKVPLGRSPLFLLALGQERLATLLLGALADLEARDVREDSERALDDALEFARIGVLVLGRVCLAAVGGRCGRGDGDGVLEAGA